MIKIKINTTFQIPDDEFDGYCKEYRIGRNTAKIGIRNLLEDRIWKYLRNLDSLVNDYNHQLHIEESGWTNRGAKPSEKDVRKKQYELFKQLKTRRSK